MAPRINIAFRVLSFKFSNFLSEVQIFEALPSKILLLGFKVKCRLQKNSCTRIREVQELEFCLN
jgi:hypothetical protein